MLYLRASDIFELSAENKLSPENIARNKYRIVPTSPWVSEDGLTVVPDSPRNFVPGVETLTSSKIRSLYRLVSYFWPCNIYKTKYDLSYKMGVTTVCPRTRESFGCYSTPDCKASLKNAEYKTCGGWRRRRWKIFFSYHCNHQPFPV